MLDLTSLLSSPNGNQSRELIDFLLDKKIENYINLYFSNQFGARQFSNFTAINAPFDMHNTERIQFHGLSEKELMQNVKASAARYGDTLRYEITSGPSGYEGSAFYINFTFSLVLSVEVRQKDILNKAIKPKKIEPSDLTPGSSVNKI